MTNVINGRTCRNSSVSKHATDFSSSMSPMPQPITISSSFFYTSLFFFFLDCFLAHLNFSYFLTLSKSYVFCVLKCITTVTYLVLINGEAHGKITPTRRLRQGDPLSSYLFLLCMEAFSALITDASDRHCLNGVSICRGCLMVTHLFFTGHSPAFL